MTNELEYNGRTEPCGRTFGRRQSAAQQPKRQQPERFQLPNGVFDHAARLGAKGKFSGGDVVNVICAFAAHVNARTGNTYVLPRTVASETDLPVKVVEAIIACTEAAGILQPGRWNGKTTQSFIPHDGDGGGYRLVNLQWWNENAALGKSRGLLQHLLAIADGKSRFTANVNRDLLPQLGLSRAGFYRLLAPLKNCDLVRTRQQGRATEIEMPCVPRKKRPQSISAAPQCVSQPTPCVSRPTRCVSTDPPEPLPVAACGTEGYALQGYEVQEVQEQETRSTPEARRAKTGACEPTLRPNFSRSLAETPPTPGWSKATSGPRQVVRNGRLHELHEVVCDALGLRDLDRGILPRINGMLCRMPYRTLDEFRDAMAGAVEGLREQWDIWPNSAFYHDDEKAVVWAVGQATGCSLWNVCNASVDEAQRACRAAPAEAPPKNAAVSGEWLHAHLCDKGMIELDGELLLCPHCAAAVPEEKHGCECGWRSVRSASGQVDVWHCPYCRARDHGCVGDEWSDTEDRVVISLDANGRLVQEPCQQCADEREAETSRRSEMEPQDAEPSSHAERGFDFFNASRPQLEPGRLAAAEAA